MLFLGCKIKQNQSYFGFFSKFLLLLGTLALSGNNLLKVLSLELVPVVVKDVPISERTIIQPYVGIGSNTWGGVSGSSPGRDCVTHTLGVSLKALKGGAYDPGKKQQKKLTPSAAKKNTLFACFSKNVSEIGIFYKFRQKIIDFFILPPKAATFFSRKSCIFALFGPKIPKYFILTQKPQNILFLPKNPKIGKKYFLGKKI